VFIEFVAQAQGAGFLTPHLLKMLESDIAEWAKIHEIPYTTKYYKNTYRLAFNNDKHYTIFSLTWLNSPYIEYKIIDRQW